MANVGAVISNIRNIMRQDRGIKQTLSYISNLPACSHLGIGSFILTIRCWTFYVAECPA